MMAEGETVNSAAGQAEAFDLARKCLCIFGVVNAIVVGTVIVVAFAGGAPGTFMWVRALILLAMAPVLLWLARRAGCGDESALGRLRLVPAVLPVAIVGVDLIPGICPVWYAAMQGLGALALVPVAVVASRWAAVGSAVGMPEPGRGNDSAGGERTEDGNERCVSR